MPTKLDGKFHGIIAKNKDGSVVPQDQWVVFLAKDNAFLPTLEFYYEECQRQGAKYQQLAAVKDLIQRIIAWRTNNPQLCKVPDTDPNELVV